MHENDARNGERAGNGKSNDRGLTHHASAVPERSLNSLMCTCLVSPRHASQHPCVGRATMLLNSASPAAIHFGLWRHFADAGARCSADVWLLYVVLYGVWAMGLITWVLSEAAAAVSCLLWIRPSVLEVLQNSCKQMSSCFAG